MSDINREIQGDAESVARNEGKYLTFNLAEEEYGIPVMKVKEIIGMINCTSVPRSPDYVKGVINLRGRVIPVIDLRLKFGLEELEHTEKTCIIVIESQSRNLGKCWEVKSCGKKECPAYENDDRRCWMISGTFLRDEIQGSYHEKIEACQECDFYRNAQRANGVFSVGLVVDSVSDVLNIKKGEIEEAPDFGASLDTECILGMAKMDGGVKILLDIDSALNDRGTTRPAHPG